MSKKQLQEKVWQQVMNKLTFPKNFLKFNLRVEICKTYANY